MPAGWNWVIGPTGYWQQADGAANEAAFGAQRNTPQELAQFKSNMKGIASYGSLALGGGALTAYARGAVALAERLGTASLATAGGACFIECSPVDAVGLAIGVRGSFFSIVAPESAWVYEAQGLTYEIVTMGADKKK